MCTLDYFGLFSHYLDFPGVVNGTELDKYDEWKYRWLPSLYRKIDDYGREDKLAYLRKICLRIRRVQLYMDSIDHRLKNNIDYDSDDGYGSHDKIIEFLDIVFDALKDDIHRRSEKLSVSTDH